FLEDADPSIEIVSARYLPQLAGELAGLSVSAAVVPDASSGSIDLGVPVHYGEPRYAPEYQVPSGGPAPHDIAAILYTSGTTGPSKGVPVSWIQVTATYEGALPQDELGEDDVFYAPFGPFHITGR